jgi:hypothetical protein
MSMDFIDELERELRAASRRRARLALARVPRATAGVATVVVAVAISVAVAVPLLQARSRPTGRHQGAAGHNRSNSVVVGCGRSVSGRLPAGWRTSRHGTVVAGPITWLYLVRNANRAAIHRAHFVQALAVVEPGRAVTVSILPSERGRLSLDYTDNSPRARFRVSQGTAAVTFKPCPGPAGRTQFNGGFIIAGPRCAGVAIQPAGESEGVRFIPMGRACPVAPPLLRIDRVLQGDGVGQARFGDTPKTAASQIVGLLQRRPSKPYHFTGACQIDHEIDWPGLNVYFHHGRFAGYAYWGSKSREPVLATAKGLHVGDTVKTGQRLYRAKFHVSPYQGGAWWVTMPNGRLKGFTSGVTNPTGKILSIEAGDVGCPAMTP